MNAYYNEFDPFAAAWLRNLSGAGLIAPGEVDERSIEEVQADDLRGFDQAHFFAGIGGWSLALRLARWPDDKPVWTGSCPCQPLSSAGQRRGHADERHLWPAFFRLIAECRPAVVFGEQVASALGREWLAAVRLDLEHARYACGAADLPAASVGAPHLRQRLFWVADDGSERRREIGADSRRGREGSRAQRLEQRPLHRSASGGLADADGGHSGQAGAGRLQPGGQHRFQPEDRGAGRRLGDAGGTGLPAPERQAIQRAGWWGEGAAAQQPSGPRWADAAIIPCADGKLRPVPADAEGRLEPTLFPLVDAGAVRNRVGLLRGSGNAIVPQVAAEFIGAVMGCRP